MAFKVLAPKGTFIAKVFQGEGFDDVFRTLKSNYESVVTRKPEASRPRSREVYLVAKGFNPS